MITHVVFWYTDIPLALLLRSLLFISLFIFTPFILISCYSLIFLLFHFLSVLFHSFHFTYFSTHCFPITFSFFRFLLLVSFLLILFLGFFFIHVFSVNSVLFISLFLKVSIYGAYLAWSDSIFSMSINEMLYFLSIRDGSLITLGEGVEDILIYLMEISSPLLDLCKYFDTHSRISEETP